MTTRQVVGPLQDWKYGAITFGYFSPDSSLLWMLTGPPTMWDRLTRRRLWASTESPYSYEFSRDGSRLFLNRRVLDARTGVAFRDLPEGDVVWASKDARILWIKHGNAVFRWDVDAGEPGRAIDLTTPDRQANEDAFNLLRSGAYTVDQLTAIAHRALRECPGTPLVTPSARLRDPGEAISQLSEPTDPSSNNADAHFCSSNSAY